MVNSLPIISNQRKNQEQYQRDRACDNTNASTVSGFFRFEVSGQSTSSQ